MAASQIQSLQRAMQLLTMLEKGDGSMSLRELAEQTGLPRSTVHRILSTLLDEGAVEQNANGKYGLGLRLFELGAGVASMRDITTIAKPYMQSISEEIRESVSLAVLTHGEALQLAFVEAPSAFHVVTREGSVLPAHCTVQGKLLLAYLPVPEVRRIVRDHGLSVFTPNTIHTREALEKELETIRTQGFALDDSEFHTGLHSVAAPIYDSDGSVKYSISIVSMFHKIGSPEFEYAKKLAVRAARDISRVRGYRGDAFNSFTE